MTTTAPKKKPTPEQIKQIIANYTAMRTAVTEAGVLTLTLARHPDITPEFLDEGLTTYRRLFSQLRDVHMSCLQAIGPNHTHSFRPYPWETPL